MRKALFSKLWFLALIGLDAFTKMLALRWIPPLNGSSYPFGGISVFEDFFGVSFSLNTAFNTGTAWGLFPNHPSLLLALRLCIIGALLVHLLFSRKTTVSQFPLWLIAAGAIGNVVDMVAYSHVIDFFHLQFFGWSFPIFNVADSCISIGVALLIFWPNRESSLQTEST